MQQQHSSGEMPQVNPGYGKFQLAKALMTSEQHTDSATRTRARLKVAKWIDVLQSTGCFRIRVVINAANGSSSMALRCKR